MKRMRWLALGIVVALGVGTMAATAGAQSSSNETPKATDVGITDKEIHIAVIADVDNPLAPNLFKASPDALETEFVCIPRPVERATTPDGGPLRYRVVHRARLWGKGERPVLEQRVVEGDPGLSI